MKINDIILKEGIFDTFKKDYQKWNTDRGIQKAGQVGATAWKNYLAKLERANDYEELNAKQLTDHLGKWIDKSLFGNYSLETSPLKGEVNRKIAELVRDPKNDAKLQQQFKDILDKTRKLALDPDAKEDPNKMTSAGQKVCGDKPTTVSGDSIFVCGQEVKRGDPGHAELAKKLGIAK